MPSGPAWLLASAFLHASWNALVKREREPQAAVVGVLAAALALSAVVALALPGAGLPSRGALGWGIAAGLFEAAYFVTLGEALGRATYGAVYAIARGGALVVVWPIAALVLREPLTARGAAGVALVTAGVVLVAAAGRERASRGGIAFAVACAASIAGYHVCYGLALAAGAAAPPLFTLAFGVALPFVWLQARLAGRLAGGLGRGAPLRLGAAGALATASFLLFLVGLAGSGAGVALTLRNTSVVFAQLLAAALGEPVPRRQLAGAALVVAGAALVAVPCGRRGITGVPTGIATLDENTDRASRGPAAAPRRDLDRPPRRLYATAPMRPENRFDASYYRRFYSGPRRVHAAREVAALASGVCGLAEWLGLELADVLDVGAGPGHFGRWLRRHRPRARLRSIDVSPYACARYGHERRDISRWRARSSFDLVVCHGVLQYLDDDGAARAIENLGRMCRGLLYLEALTRRDLAVAVDRDATDTAVHARTGAWYRRRLERWFVQVGAGLWASRRSGIVLYELEGPRAR